MKDLQKFSCHQKYFAIWKFLVETFIIQCNFTGKLEA